MTRPILTLILLTLSVNLWAQTKIKGTVKDSKGENLPGVNLMIKDSYDGTSSLTDGTFSMISDEKGKQILIASFVGYKTFEQTVYLNGSEINLTISLREEINQLDAVVISAGSFTAGDEKRRTILKAIDIATTAGATADIAGALNTLPGTQKVGETGRLFVRGGTGNETRTFIDGMVVLSAYNPSAPNTPSRGRFPPFMFKGISFSTGGYSAEYGQALSSTLVLNSKDKAEINQTDIGLLSVGVDIAHTQVWEKASWTGKVQYTNLNPYMGLVKQRLDWKTAPISLEGSTVYRQKVGKSGMLKLFGNFNNSNFEMYTHAILDPTVRLPYKLANNYGYGNASYQTLLNEKWNMRSGLSYTYNKNDVTLGDSILNETEKGIHAKSVFEHSLSDQVEIRLGGEVIDRNYSASRYDTISKQFQSRSFNESISSFFGEVEAYASKHFVAKAGGRFEYNSLINQASVDPRFSMAYKPAKKGQVSLAYGSFRQTPENQYTRINTQLTPERAEHFILSYQVDSERRTFRVETYYKNYFSLVKYVNNNPYQLTNSGNGYAKGIEFFWRDSKSFKNVDYWISYSYLDTKRDYLNYPYAAVPTFASSHNFSFVYKHFITPIKTQVGFTYSYTSGRPYYNPNLPAEKFQSDRTPYYQDLSTNISYLPKTYLIIYASCTNLLGRDNIFGYQYSTLPNSSGEYVSQAIRQPAPRFILLAVFITISKNKSINQLPNL
ncbi:MAG TPA: TonB-dependent receptor [Cyclobacteriaceae bacterium]|nr:TonB-dependent receptor [Cyclobacteriaceae bacterium]